MIGSQASGGIATATASRTSAIDRPTRPTSALPDWTNCKAWRTDSARTIFGFNVSQSPSRSSACLAAIP